MVPVHNNGDPKSPKRISKDRVCSCSLSTATESLAESMLQQRELRKVKAIGKATEAAREAYEGLPISAHLSKCMHAIT